MDSSQSESLSLVRFWIFEHAFKFRMKRLITALLLQREPALNLKCADCAESCTTDLPCLNHMFFLNTLLCDTLDIIVSLIHKDITVELLQTVDFEKFLMCAEILEEMYIQQKFIGFSAFNKLHMTMKIVPLILLVVRDVDHNDVMNHLNTLFPRYNAERCKEFMQKFKLNESVAKALQFRERQARFFVLQLLVAKVKLDHYIETRLAKEIKFYMETSKDILKLVISNAISPFMPKTIIEQMASGVSHDLIDSTDPAIQILLEFVQPDILEEDLFQLLNVLNPHTPVKTTFKESELEPFLLPLGKPPSSSKQSIASSQEKNNVLLQSEVSKEALVVPEKPVLNDKINKNLQSICNSLNKTESFVGEHRITSSQESCTKLGTRFLTVENLSVGGNTTEKPIIRKIRVKCADSQVPDSSVSSTECSVLLEKRKATSNACRAAKRVALSPTEQVLGDGMATQDDLRISSTRDEIEILYESGSPRTVAPVKPRLKSADKSLHRPPSMKTIKISLPGPQNSKNIKKTLPGPRISKGAVAKMGPPGPRKPNTPAISSVPQSDEDFIPDSQEIFIGSPVTVCLPDIGAFLQPQPPRDNPYLRELKVKLVFQKDVKFNGQAFGIYS